MARSSLLRRAGAWVSGLLALPLSVIPFYAYVHYDMTGRRMALAVERRFVAPPLGTLPGAEAARYRRSHLSYRNALLTLAIGGVMDGAPSTAATPEALTLPERRFAEDMQMLHAAGFNTVTPRQVVAWRSGRGRLPENALLLTFDNGRADTVLNAPPVLRRLGMKATMFVIGGVYQRAPVFYASPDALRRLTGEGWSIEAHAVHGQEAIDGGLSHRLPYLAGRERRGGRLETLAQFRVRASKEYRAARAAAASISRRPVLAFAWPFGAYGADQRTNDPRLAAINLQLARRLYALGFNEDDQDGYRLSTREDDPMRLARLRVRPDETPEELFERIELAVAASAPEVTRAAA